MVRNPLHNTNALMAAYNQSRTIPPRVKSSTGLHRANAPIPGDLVPGVGQRDWTQRPAPTVMHDGPERKRFGYPRGRTKPTPSSYYGRKKPRLD